ncbi:MAG: (Fe-S)-binding protein [Gemmatimonadota bacterium]
MPATDMVQEAISALDAKLNLALTTYLEACTHCGLCAEACHLYRADPHPRHIPSYKADTIRKVYQRYFTPTGRLFPWLFGAEELSEEVLDSWVDTVFQCTLCRRCTIECPMGIDNAALIATSRQILTAAGKAPPTLVEHGRTACDTGSPLGVTREQFLERLEWIEEELQDELDDEDFTVPLDVKGAEILFMPASLELMKYPGTVAACIRILHAAGVSWTMSSVRYDVTNFGVFLGDPQLTRTIATKDIEEARRLGVKILVTSECGHAYRALRWEAPNWFREPLPFAVKNIVELADEWVREGRLRVNREANTLPVTYHDPCNITRNGGVIEEPRRLLNASTREFREMTPNRERSWCCSGGGGFHSMPEYEDVRLGGGRMKAEQIRATGARVVATTCANCQLQLNDLSEHYDLGVRCVSVTDLLAEALVE